MGAGLPHDPMVEAAAAYGLTFRCDPMALLDRPMDDLPIVLAIQKAAERIYAAANKRG